MNQQIVYRAFLTIPMSNFTQKLTDIQTQAFQVWAYGSRCARTGFFLALMTA